MRKSFGHLDAWPVVDWLRWGICVERNRVQIKCIRYRMMWTFVMSWLVAVLVMKLRFEASQNLFWFDKVIMARLFLWDSFTESLLKIGFGRESRLPALQSMKGMFVAWLSRLRKIKLNKVRCSSKGGSDGVCQSNQILFYYFSYKYRVILSFNQVHP